MAKGIGMDLFERKKLAYLIIVDYYSSFIEIARLDRATAEAVIQRCKIIFSRHSIAKEVVTNNGSQFDPNTFCRFSKEYQFHHVIRSPYYPRSRLNEG